MKRVILLLVVLVGGSISRKNHQITIIGSGSGVLCFESTFPPVTVNAEDIITLEWTCTVPGLWRKVEEGCK